jgi:hypothetical protein|tara:strand:- start:15506 stop:15652 length:147 start_codon:yes stop_codon:yes gene_type:complete
MKKPPYIRNSVKFFGKFEVVVDDDYVIPCHNLATARSIKKRYEVANKC